jgi:glutamate dehydrogenase
MRETVRATAAALQDNPPPLAPHELAELVAFLDWLATDNFTFLGIRASGEERGLGVLRDGAAPDATPAAVAVSKSPELSRVHRRANYDIVDVALHDRDGRVTGVRRFLGLFTSQALSSPPRAVPLLRRKVAAVSDALGFDPKGHAGKALAHVLESLPKEELFATSPERLTAMALGILSLIDRPRPKLFVRTEPRSVSALVFVPRDDYTSLVRERVGKLLKEAFDADLTRYEVELRAEGLARVHYVLTPKGALPAIDEPALDRRLNEVVRGWGQSLESALGAFAGPARAARLAITHGAAFSAAYQSQFGAEEAARDILILTDLHDASQRDVQLYRRATDAPHRLRLKIYRLGEIIPLSDAVPVLEHFGFRVIEEFPFDLDDGRLGWIHDFLLESSDGSALAVDELRLRVEPALRAVLTGAQENDQFNALVIAAKLDARAVGWVRAYFRYLRQTGVSYGIATIVDALRRHADLTADLVALFEARFDPEIDGERADAMRAVHARIDEGLAAVTAIDDDRILRLYRSVIEATLRTNAFVPGGPEALAFKLDSRAVPNLPPPVPYREIWVYSPRVEGIHLRGGPIARGGLRWSDRRDDFRTEVLGLVKAQMVKNAVIVPNGAKGGFYPKQLPSPVQRDAWLAEGTESYRVFIRALLAVTDNLVDGTVVPPEAVVRHDDADPYLVVAADKGTATFSDVANAISEDHGFWLGDAFASGGRYGYDHKAMGITAKGGWISVQRHFREMNIDVQSEPVRVIGVGDMSGDVFGNGMLLSKALKLVAAFDHRHIFLDPDPDPAKSYAERERLFALPRSSWADYDAGLISAGGGVFPRDQKSIPLSPQARAMLGVDAEAMGPSDLMAAILRMQADLCWFGGIGTYVKAASESNADVGDRANDAHRVNAEDMRVRVVGEGANLGLTQAARIAFARAGGRINTDFIDNSAGVDCSDNEVNIKIALNPEVAAGRFGLEARNELLGAMTDEVANLVLRDNIMQTQAISVAESGGAGALPSFNRVIHRLEASGRLDRGIEGLPSDDMLAQRMQAGHGLERPELAVLLAYAKMALKDALVASTVVDDPILTDDLEAAFPAVLVERFGDAIRGHRLRREIIATKLANQIVNRGGIALAFELSEEQATTLAHIGAAFVAARELFDLRRLWRAIDAAPVPATVQITLQGEAIAALRVQLDDLLRVSSAAMSPSELIERLRPGVARIEGQIDSLLRPAPPEIADGLVRVHAMDGAVGVADLAADIGASEQATVEAYTLLGQRLGLDWAKGVASTLRPVDPWERLLVAGLQRDFEQIRLDVIRRVASSGQNPVAAVGDWLGERSAQADRIAATVTRAKSGPAVSTAMLAHLASQARAALG